MYSLCSIYRVLMSCKSVFVLKSGIKINMLYAYRVTQAQWLAVYKSPCTTEESTERPCVLQPAGTRLHGCSRCQGVALWCISHGVLQLQHVSLVLLSLMTLPSCSMILVINYLLIPLCKSLVLGAGQMTSHALEALKARFLIPPVPNLNRSLVIDKWKRFIDMPQTSHTLFFESSSGYIVLM